MCYPCSWFGNEFSDLLYTAYSKLKHGRGLYMCSLSSMIIVLVLWTCCHLLPLSPPLLQCQKNVLDMYTHTSVQIKEMLACLLCFAGPTAMQSTGIYARIAPSCIHLSSKKKHVCYVTNFLLQNISVNMSHNVGTYFIIPENFVLLIFARLNSL